MQADVTLNKVARTEPAFDTCLDNFMRYVNTIFETIDPDFMSLYFLLGKYCTNLDLFYSFKYRYDKCNESHYYNTIDIALNLLDSYQKCCKLVEILHDRYINKINA